MQFAKDKTVTGLRDALGWRLRRVFGDRAVDVFLIACARRWRPMLKKPVFIGVTGSAGKTTTKELMLGMLSHKGRGVGNEGSYSNIDKIAEALLRLAPTHNFFVTELSGHRRNEMDENLSLVRPSIGIVTVIGDDHSSADYPREAIAQEKGKLIASLPPTGTAVLNADDELVLAMAADCTAKIITYGTSPKADLRAEDISSVWPERLKMALVRGSERVKLQTQLCGTHWIPAVLGAIGGGLATGMTLAECAEGIASVDPFDGRMQPVTTNDGVTFIRDDFKAPLWTVDACFEFMKAARATRKIIVIGELSNVGSKKGTKYEETAKLARGVADIAIFVGPWASSVLKTRKPGDGDTLRAFSHVRGAAEYLNSITREGDLVLLKGSNKQDHLLRIILARDGDVACWRDDCKRNSFCNKCPDRNKVSGVPLSMKRHTPREATPQVSLIGQCAISFDEQVIIGLGNPEAQYAGTPHNIGYEVLDHLASSLALTWNTTPEAWIARGSSQGRSVCLIKTRMAMNGTGAGLKQLSERMRFTNKKCILVYDDPDILIGSVRTRISGSAGGHHGIASILEAFQTDEFRRVKVGVGLAGTKLNRAEYVLTTFDAQSRTAVDLAIPAAGARIREMVLHVSVAQGASSGKY